MESTRKTYVWSEGKSAKVNLVTLVGLSQALAYTVVVVVRSILAQELTIDACGVLFGGLGYITWGYIWWRLIAPELVSARSMWQWPKPLRMLVAIMILPFVLTAGFVTAEMMMVQLQSFLVLCGGQVALEFGVMWLNYKQSVYNGRGFFEYCNLERKL